MIKNFKILFLGGLMALSVVACKKGDDGGDSPKVGSGGSMSAKVDGKSWSAGLAVQAIKTNGVLAIGGTGNGGQININLLDYSKPGTFDLGGSPTNGNHAIYTVVSLPPTVYSNMVGQGSGTVTIKSDDGNYIEGTFSFTAKNAAGGGTQVSVTDGKFKAKLQ